MTIKLSDKAERHIAAIIKNNAGYVVDRLEHGGDVYMMVRHSLELDACWIWDQKALERNDGPDRYDPIPEWAWQALWEAAPKPKEFDESEIEDALAFINNG